MPLSRAWAVVEFSSADLPLSLLDHRRRQLLQWLAGPHGVDLNLRGALQVIESVIGVGHRHTQRRDAMICHEQHALVANDLGEALAFFGFESRAGVLVVVGNRVGQTNLGLTNLLDARILKPRKSTGKGHVSVEDRHGLRQRFVNRRVDAVAGALYVAGSPPDLAGGNTDLHERRGRHFGPMHAKRNLIIEVTVARHHEREVVENSLTEAMRERETVRGREIDPRPPFSGAALQSGWRKPDLH